MDNITYVFSGGRKKKYKNHEILAKEFFYGLPYFDSLKYNIRIIEFSNSNNIFNYFWRMVDKFMSKVISLPFSSSKLVNLNNLKVLMKTNQLILVNENIACSILPLLILLKFFKKIKVSVFVMGLKFPKIKIVHNLVIKFLILFIDNVFFLGKGEYEIAKKLHSDSKKLKIFPFSIDEDFWRPEKEIKIFNNEQILFVGNDGNRDYKLLTDIAKKLPNYKFVFVSKAPELQKVKMKNVEVLDGQWGSDKITDFDLKKIYENSRITIIPLKESTQPSGQSVALQSMSMGIPVIISKTEGFWDKENFFDNENILFIQNNNLQEWIVKIENLYNNEKLIKQVSESSIATIKKNFKLEHFNLRLLSYIGN